MDHTGFSLPLYIDLAAVYLMGVTGAVEAIRRGFDLMGVLTMALVTGLGGALIRDGVFLPSGPPAVLVNDGYLIAVGLAAASGILFGRRALVSERFIALVDAAALGAYAVVGMEKTLAFGLGFAPAVLVGVVNACGGGILRDILAREEPIVVKPGQFYALAVLLGCLAHMGLRRLGLGVEYAAWAGIGLTFALRVLAITRNWRTAPIRETGLLGPGRRGRKS